MATKIRCDGTYPMGTDPQGTQCDKTFGEEEEGTAMNAIVASQYHTQEVELGRQRVV